jgi:hypothetical protein
MLRINFANLNQILTFDSEVLEVFYGIKSARVHIAHVKSAEIYTNRKGAQELRINTLFGPITYMPFEPTVADRVKELVAEVQQIKETFKL